MAKHNIRRMRVKQTLKARSCSPEFLAFIAAFGSIALADSIGVTRRSVYAWTSGKDYPSTKHAGYIIGLSQTEKQRLKLQRPLTWEDILGRVEVERSEYA